MMFKYYMTQRPAMPGAMPKEGLMEIEDFDPTKPIDGVGRAYARLTYNRQLSEKEVFSYELMYDGDRHIEHYHGYEVRFNPVLTVWDVWNGDSLVATTTTREEAIEGIDALEEGE